MLIYFTVKTVERRLHIKKYRVIVKYYYNEDLKASNIYKMVLEAFFLIYYFCWGLNWSSGSLLVP